MKFKPFSDNIIFYDTEFSSLDPYSGEILSIGLVKMNGEELYLELEYDGEYSDWVRDNLVKTLTADKVSRNVAQEKIQEFIGDSKPYMLAYVNQFDALYTYKLFGGSPETPFHWLPLDFASILVGLGYNPEIYMQDNYTKLAKELKVELEEGHTHNALDDARMLRKVYLALRDRN